MEFRDSTFVEPSRVSSLCAPVGRRCFFDLRCRFIRFLYLIPFFPHLVGSGDRVYRFCLVFRKVNCHPHPAATPRYLSASAAPLFCSSPSWAHSTPVVPYACEAFHLPFTCFPITTSAGWSLKGDGVGAPTSSCTAYLGVRMRAWDRHICGHGPSLVPFLPL